MRADVYKRQILINEEYVVFSMDALNEMSFTIWTNIGSIFNVCLWTFMIVMGVYAVLNIIDHVSR